MRTTQKGGIAMVCNNHVRLLFAAHAGAWKPSSYELMAEPNVRLLQAAVADFSSDGVVCLNLEHAHYSKLPYQQPDASKLLFQLMERLDRELIDWHEVLENDFESTPGLEMLAQLFQEGKRLDSELFEEDGSLRAYLSHPEGTREWAIAQWCLEQRRLGRILHLYLEEPTFATWIFRLGQVASGILAAPVAMSGDVNSLLEYLAKALVWENRQIVDRDEVLAKLVKEKVEAKPQARHIVLRGGSHIHWLPRACERNGVSHQIFGDESSELMPPHHQWLLEDKPGLDTNRGRLLMLRWMMLSLTISSGVVTEEKNLVELVNRLELSQLDDWAHHVIGNQAPWQQRLEETRRRLSVPDEWLQQ